RGVGDGEAERPLGVQREGMGKRGADRAAMGDDDDVAPGMALPEAIDGRADPVDHRGEAFAARRRLARRSMPEAMHAAVAPGLELVIGQPLPLAEILLDEG